MKELRKARIESLNKLIDLAHKLMLERRSTAATEWIYDRAQTLRELQGDIWAMNDYLDSAQEWLSLQH